MQHTGTADSYDLSSDYRYGYNDKEKDNEIKGEANSLDFGARIYDPRVGRWMSTDSLESKYPSMSAYNYVANTPRMAIDPDGKRRHSCLRALRETLRTVIISLQMGLIKQSQYGSAHNEKVKVLFGLFTTTRKIIKYEA